MNKFDQTFISIIIDKLKIRLERELTKSEYEVFTLRRSGIAYEMIFDFISSDKKSKEEIEVYVKSVISENEKKHTMNNLSLSIFINTEANINIESITSINETDYDELFLNENLLLDFLSISNLYQVSKLNSNELLESILDFEKKLIKKRVLIMNNDSEKLNINRLLLNYLFSFRTYIDHLETFIKRKYGKESEETTKFKTLTNQLHYENFAYRFFYKLRNYAQHCGLPIDILEIQPSIINNEYSVKIKIEFHAQKLIENFNDWGNSLKKELEDFDVLDLVKITKDFMELIEQIDTWFYSLILPSIEIIKEKVKFLTKDKFENTLNLCVTYYNEKNKIFITDSVFRYITQIENYR